MASTFASKYVTSRRRYLAPEYDREIVAIKNMDRALLVEMYKEGATAEQIVSAFDTLRLADVYTVIAYYLEHTGEVEQYLREEEQQSAARAMLARLERQSA